MISVIGLLDLNSLLSECCRSARLAPCGWICDPGSCCASTPTSFGAPTEAAFCMTFRGSSCWEPSSSGPPNHALARSKREETEGTSMVRRMFRSDPAPPGSAAALPERAIVRERCEVPVMVAPSAASPAGASVPGRAPRKDVPEADQPSVDAPDRSPGPCGRRLFVAPGTGGPERPRGIPAGGAEGERWMSAAVAGVKVVDGEITCRRWIAGDGRASAVAGALL